MFEPSLIEWLLVKLSWQVLLQSAAARVLEDGHRRVKEIAQPELGSAGEMLAISRMSRVSA